MNIDKELLKGFYNNSAFIYAVLYIFLSAAGLGIGCVLRKFSKH